MNKFALLGLIGIAGSASAFTPVQKSGDVFTLMMADKPAYDPSVYDPAQSMNAAPIPAAAPAPPAPLANVEPAVPEYPGEIPPRIRTYTSTENEKFSMRKDRLANPVTFAERQMGAITVTEIRAQQFSHGMHASSDGKDYTRDTMRH